MKRHSRNLLMKFAAYSACLGLFFCAAATLPSCSADAEPAKGQLMVVVQTDMPIPKDVDSIRIEISAYGNLLFGNNYGVGPGGLLIPATLAIVAGEEPAVPVHIRLISWQNNTLRTLREAVTTVPKDRIAMLRMPIQWLCDGQAKAMGERVVGTCPDGQTCISGQCKSSNVASSELETYSPEAVFGGGNGKGTGTCFDTVPCFSQGAGVEVDISTCSIAQPASGKGTNVALVMPPDSDGICGPDACLIPLDADSAEGWRVENGRIVLPSAVCERLEEGKIVAVAVTTACETKTSSVPTCGPWSSVTEKPGNFDAGAPDVEELRKDASVDIEPDVIAEAQPDVEPDVSPDVELDVEPDVSPDVEPEGGTIVYGIPFQSCDGMAGTECQGKSCCSSLSVPSGGFPMGRSDNGNDACPSGLFCGDDEQPEHDVTVSEFSLDEYEVTVGRFRKFVEHYDGTPPPVDSGAHPMIAGSGWQSAWNHELPSNRSELESQLECFTGRATWRDTPDGTEQYPINCVSWYVAFAFCAWDGGRLPTEAEWEYAAAGGIENRLYPWGDSPPTNGLLIWNCEYGAEPLQCTFEDIAPVGALAEAGAGSWGHKDLAGSMWEWTLDGYDEEWYSGGGNACNDCANLSAGDTRVTRGGGWTGSDSSSFRVARRMRYMTEAWTYDLGFRCAR